MLLLGLKNTFVSRILYFFSLDFCKLFLFFVLLHWCRSRVYIPSTRIFRVFTCKKFDRYHILHILLARERERDRSKCIQVPPVSQVCVLYSHITTSRCNGGPPLVAHLKLSHQFAYQRTTSNVWCYHFLPLSPPPPPPHYYVLSCLLSETPINAAAQTNVRPVAGNQTSTL